MAPGYFVQLVSDDKGTGLRDVFVEVEEGAKSCQKWEEMGEHLEVRSLGRVLFRLLHSV